MRGKFSLKVDPLGIELSILDWILDSWCNEVKKSASFN